MRVSPLQAAKRIGREEGMLWCAAIHHGEWRKGLRSGGFRKAESRTC